MMRICALFCLITQLLQAGDWFGYVSTQLGLVVPFNLTTNGLGGPLLVGGAECRNIAISPDGQTAYVAATSSNLLYPIDLTNNTVGMPFTVGNTPLGVAISPDGGFVYVTNDGDGTVTYIDLTTLVQGTITVGSNPLSIAITPNGKFAYVTNFSGNTLSIIDCALKQVVNSLAFGTNAVAIAIAPNGQTGYLLAETQEGVNTVFVFDIATNTLITQITVPIESGGIVITADGTKAYVYMNADRACTVSPIDLATNSAGAAIPVGDIASGIAASPDSKSIYVTLNGDNGVAVIDVATNTLRTTVADIFRPFCIAITPDQAPTAAFTFTFGSTSTFDATLSTSPVGTIVSYFWDFGDGSTATTSLPTIAHTYARGGTYTVSLTVTNSAGTSTSQTTSFTSQMMSRVGGPSAQISHPVTVTIPVDPPLPPTHFQGKRIRVHKNKHCTNYLTWQKSRDSTVVGYAIFRNHRLVRTTSARAQAHFFDKKKHLNRSYDYVIQSYNLSGVESVKKIVHLHKK